MKKLSGMKNISSLENKKVEALALGAIQGGRRKPKIGASIVHSNFLNNSGQQDVDFYNEYGEFVQRYWDNLPPGC